LTPTQDLVLVTGDLKTFSGLFDPNHGHVGQQLLVRGRVNPAGHLQFAVLMTQ